MPVVGVGDLPSLQLADPTTEASVNGTQPLQQQQQLPGCLVHMLQVAGIQAPWLATIKLQSLPRAASSSVHHRPKSPKKASSPSKAEQARRLQVAELSSAASSFLTFLRLQLSQQVLGWFQADHEELWQDVLINKPPWDDLQFVEVLLYHFNSTIKAGWC